MRIYLIGFMASGKSSLGKRLAKKLEYPFFDLDQVVEEESGKSITELFEEDGETVFRGMERAMLHRLSRHTRAVIATGGGTPCFFDNMDYMNATGVSVYLKMSPQSLVYRLKNAQTKRPLLAGKKGEALEDYVRQTLGEREVFYQRAHCVIKGESARAEQIKTMIFG